MVIQIGKTDWENKTNLGIKYESNKIFQIFLYVTVLGTDRGKKQKEMMKTLQCRSGTAENSGPNAQDPDQIIRGAHISPCILNLYL